MAEQIKPQEEILSLSTPSSIIDTLFSQGKLSQSDIDTIRRLGASAQHLDLHLVKQGLLTEQELAQAYCELYDLPLLEKTFELQQAIAKEFISAKFMKQNRFIPVDITETTVMIAMVNPEDEFTLKAIAMAVDKSVEVTVATATQIAALYEQYYGDAQFNMSELTDEINAESNNQHQESIEKLKDLASEAPIVRLVNHIIMQAIDMRASDIHIEPFENQLIVRYRVDGLLQEVESPPSQSTAAVISRIKIMANLNIAERRLPQDGRIQLRTSGKKVDLRVSTTPTVHGESLVLRILDKEAVAIDLNTLGLEIDTTQNLEKLLAMPNGILLITGPTGSGKTTSLYAALQHLNTTQRKIFTVEDPVEYQLDRANQIQVKPQIGLTFSAALRSIVRQDPDIIMIGEMRDAETAQIATQSALTGHLVLSTLHTNDAGSSVTRLLDMGIENYLLTSTLNGVMAQRLVRTLCKSCRLAYTPSNAVLKIFSQNQVFDSTLPIMLFKPVGCEMCANTGYKGRTVISELLVMSESIRNLILAKADGNMLQQQAIKDGMLTLKQDGFRKVLKGLTTIEEVTRVANESE